MTKAGSCDCRQDRFFVRRLCAGRMGDSSVCLMTGRERTVFMTSRTREMTAGRPASLLLGFALPLMLGNVFQQLYTVVDTAIVGKALGVGALAALGATDWLNWMMLGIIQGLTQGFAILMAQEFGARRFERLRRALGGGTVLSAAGAVVLAILGQLAAGPVLRLMQTPQEILPDALLYLRIIYGGVPVVMAYNLLASILRAVGDSKTPLRAMIAAAFTNIGLDLLFVLVFRWGIAGAAAATLIAQLVSGLYCLVYVRRVEVLLAGRADFRLADAPVKKLMLLSAPMAFQNILICAGGLIVQFVVNGCGVVFIAGFTATNKLYGILEVAAVSYGYALITYVGQNLGAGEIPRIRSGVRAAYGIAAVTSVVIAAVMLLFGRPVLGCFISGTPEETRAAMDVAYLYLSIMSVFLPVLYYLHVTRAAIQGMGNTVLPMITGVAEFAMRTLAALLLPLVLGETGVLYAEIAAWIGASAVLAVSYRVLMRRLETGKPAVRFRPEESS